MFITFFVSLLFISSMISLKVFEEKVGKKTFISEKISSLDFLALKLIFDIKNKIKIFFINLKVFLLKQTISYLRNFFGSVKSHIDEKYIELHGNFRGKRVLNSKGSVSFYLRDISKYKNNNFKDIK